MPYDSNQDLPVAIRELLPIDAQAVFRDAANEAIAKGADQNEAIIAGWAPVRDGWRRPDQGRGKWVKRAKVHKDGPTISDVHVPSTDQTRKKPKRPGEEETTVKSHGGVNIYITTGAAPEPIAKTVGYDEHRTRIVKIDKSRRIVYGWANVITESGVPVEDADEHIIRPGELVKFTTEFMIGDRIGKTNHAGDPTHMVVHSFPLTYELAKALGIETPDEGWLVGVYVHDADTMARVESGDLVAFSIGGYGDPVPLG